MEHVLGMAGRAWVRRALGALLLVALTATSMASAGRTPRPLDYHATLLNGRVTGSSFLISEGVAVTNAHVLAGRGVGEAIAFQPARGGRMSATILAVSPRMDLAVLGVPGGVLPVLRQEVRAAAGGRLVAAGIVPGPGRIRPTELAGTVVTAQRTIPAYGPGFVARIPGVQKGFSGGPVLDGRGRLVGMLTALRPTAAARNVGNEAFILSAREVRREARRLLGGV